MRGAAEQAGSEGEQWKRDNRANQTEARLVSRSTLASPDISQGIGCEA
jgi:hypothetical protein